MNSDGMRAFATAILTRKKCVPDDRVIEWLCRGMLHRGDYGMLDNSA